MTSISEAKALLRSTLRREAMTLTSAARTAAAEGACRQIAAQEIWQNAQTVLFYWALPDEIDLGGLLTLALASGKAAAFPKFHLEHGHYVPVAVRDLSRELAPGKFGIPEPGDGCPIVPLKQLDLCLVPGVAFDTVGRRLGRGKGFYDRLLKDVGGTKCGVAFDWQVRDQIPTESHDVVLDCLLTPTKWFDFRTARL